MIGNIVALWLKDSVPSSVRGILKRIDTAGVWIWHLDGANSQDEFYPMHRVMKIEDEGRAP